MCLKSLTYECCQMLFIFQSLHRILENKMAAFLAILFFIAVATSSPVNNKVEDQITKTYNNVLNSEIEKGVGSIKISELPRKMKDFIQKIGEHQLPLIHSQIKEEVKGYKNDVTQFIDNEVRNYIEPLRIKEFVHSHLRLHRRDDEEMPNYLDHFYGGLGK